MTNAIVSARNLRKTFPSDTGNVAVLDGLDFDLEEGTTAALLGESGSGKSTFLHLVGGLEVADSGELSVCGQDVTQLTADGLSELRRERLALVFQQFNLIPSLNVRDNITFQASLAGRQDADWTDHLIERLGLTGLERRYPEQLSGGQQQRVAIGRALAGRPPLLLADEPTGNLDEATGDTVLDLMLDLVRDSGATLLMVTHSARIAARLDRSFTLKAGRLT